MFQLVPLATLLREPLRNGKSAQAAAEGHGVRIFTLTAVTKNDFSLGNTKISVLTDADAQGLWAEPGDIFVQRSNTPELVGTAALYNGPRNFALFPDLLIRVRPSDLILARFLALYLQSNTARRFFQGAARGIAGSMPKIGQGVIESLLVPVPPVDVQSRIVTAIELQLSRLDAAISSLTRAKANLERARASVLKAAVEGRLVPTEAALARSEGRDYEPASALLARILTERRARWAENGGRAKYHEPIEPRPTTTISLPAGWILATMEQIITVTGGIAIEQGWSPKCDDVPAASSDWAVMTTTAIQPGFFDPSAHKRLPDALVSRPDLQLMPGDLLVTRAGPRKRVGITCLVRQSRPKLLLCDKAYRFRVSTDIVPAYVETALNSFELLRTIEAMKSGISDSGLNITQKGFLALLLPIPPLAEQRRITTEVDRRLSVLAAIELSVDADLARCARLRQSILKRAFEGRLVPPKPATNGKSGIPVSPQDATQ